ncbi:hypothetical protein IMG5_137940 [Ichthyophthirius multifiliis]|uniref:CSC1/OSCA1-like cytosolic domain-containing protein n=1 Tax=Ichthyophthirius multifiliis TaxID=5932 RepID=G0QX48_ICHMU|nr:hypothetical protein IMG5_137940 [Ichthyophthirius multifiliis]EGR30205.1 hypothetical protein IMG5_137940 [Ichthyophthirius multifiliis]|eukprot:XP_004031801.1 hypothetical protein IMG5_137940 [Ichthyophthirius multifiliis]
MASKKINISGADKKQPNINKNSVVLIKKKNIGALVIQKQNQNDEILKIEDLIQEIEQKNLNDEQNNQKQKNLITNATSSSKNQKRPITNNSPKKDSETESTYDPDQIPADFKQAKQHSQKSRKYKTQFMVRFNLIIILGSGFPLFFTYIKFCLMFLIILFGVSGIFNTVTNGTIGQYCEQQKLKVDQDQCDSNNWITKYSLGNKRNENQLMDIQSALNLFSIFIIIILLQYFRYVQRKTDVECDVADISVNDYTIMINNIPKKIENALNDDYDDDLKDFLEKNAFPGGKKLNIVKVNLCYDLDELKTLHKYKRQKILKKQKLLSYFYNKGQYPQGMSLEKVNQEVYIADKNKETLEAKFADGKGKQFMEKYFSGWAFVSLQTEQEKEEIIDLYDCSFIQMKIKGVKPLVYHGNQLVIKQAPQPTDIFWENLKLSDKQRSQRNLLGTLFSLLVLGACFGLLYGLITAQKSLNTSSNNDNQTIVQIVGIAISVVISIFNEVLKIILVEVAKKEGHITITKFNISQAKKISIAQFCNTSLITFLVEIVITNNNKSKFLKIFGNGGLAQNQNYVFISNMVISFVTQALDVGYYVKKLKRKLQEKRVQNLFQLNHNQMSLKNINYFFKYLNFKMLKDYMRIRYILQKLDIVHQQIRCI